MGPAPCYGNENQYQATHCAANHNGISAPGSVTAPLVSTMSNVQEWQSHNAEKQKGLINGTVDRHGAIGASADG